MIEHMKARRSVRTFSKQVLTEDVKQQLLALAAQYENPYGIPVSFRYLDAKAHGLVCPMTVGTDLFVGGRIQDGPHACVAFGYSFEAFVLCAQALGLGTVWLGGTMNRPAYEKAMELAADERMLCAAALGYAAEKRSIRENKLRRVIRADERIPFERLFFAGSFESPLTMEQAGRLTVPLELVRRGPSASNKQPWRAVVCGSTVHFYLQRTAGYIREGIPDMQLIDMGIALCHFDLAAKELGLDPQFLEADPGLPAGDAVYIASYRIG